MKNEFFYRAAAYTVLYFYFILIEWHKACVSNLAYFHFLSLAHFSEGCTVGNITQVTISDASFPFGYDQTQFDLCLDISVLKDNLYSICEKVDDNNFQKIILKKLNQVILAFIGKH